MAWSYDKFKVSSGTSAADKKRQELEAKQPGDFTYKDYAESDTVTQAKNALSTLQKPGAYQSQWQQSIDDTLNKILNREKFTYDVNGDALYQQYKDQYATQGKMAMMDTMGQAAAMTGGYGNSYAQSVGQQAYQGYLQQLNDKVPELYQLALDQYNREGDELYNQYGLFADREETDYGRHRDTVSDYNTERDYLTNRYYTESEQDYNRYNDSYSKAYNQYRDSVSDWQQTLARADENYFNLYDRDYNRYSDDRTISYDDYWNTTNFNYQQQQDAIANQMARDQLNETIRANKVAEAAAAAKSSSGSGGSSGGSSLTASEWQSVNNNCAAYKASGDNNGLANYINGLVNRGYISEDEAADLYDSYKGVTTSTTSRKATSSTKEKYTGSQLPR